MTKSKSQWQRRLCHCPSKPVCTVPRILIRCRSSPSLGCEYAVGLRSAIAEELPHPPDFSDHVEIEIGDHHFVFVPACLGNDFPARIAEVAFAIKFTDVPGLLFANPIDRADKIAIRHRMRSEEHTSELQSPYDLVCRLLLEKKKKKQIKIRMNNNTHNRKIKL